jgi:hypothetical protein
MYLDLGGEVHSSKKSSLGESTGSFTQSRGSPSLVIAGSRLPGKSGYLES